MALDKDIVGSIEFLEVVGLQGSTYLLKGPNGENVKLNQSEMNDDDELEVGEEYSFFIYPNRSGELFATQNMPDITKDKYDFAKVLKTDRSKLATFKRRKNNKKQDLILLRHEALEHYLMNKYNFNYDYAYKIVSKNTIIQFL